MNLSGREYQIAELIAWGASDKEVAMELSIDVTTARTHRRNIERKIHAHNSADLTRWFFEHKMRMSFGLNPRHVQHIAMLLFLMVIYAEFSNLPVIRLRSSRAGTAGTEMVRVRSRARNKRNEYILA